MIAPSWLVAGLLGMQLGGAAPAAPVDPPEDGPAPPAASSRIVAVTVYQGQALVTREVAVPEGPGTVELVVTPLPAGVVPGSLFAEGGAGIRVLGTRYRARIVRDDLRDEVRAATDRARQLAREAQRLRREIAVQEEDLQFLGKLGDFAGRTVAGLVEQGRFEDRGIIGLGRFVMDSRAEKAKAEVDLRQQLEINAEAARGAGLQLDAATGGASRVERDAVIVVAKDRPEAGTIRLGHLVGGATWRPEYRLRQLGEAAPVRLESLAAVAQQTGEPWPAVPITLSTAPPAGDAAPPDLLPLRMADAAADAAAGDGPADRSRRVAAELDRPLDLPFRAARPLAEVLGYIRENTRGPAFPDGIPIYLDPRELQDADRTPESPVAIDLRGVPLRAGLRLLLGQLDLAYAVRDGLVAITRDVPGAAPADEPAAPAAPPGGSALNRAAAGAQAAELRVGDGAADGPAGGDGAAPSVSFTLAEAPAIPSRRDPLLLEVARADLPAEPYAQAVPVLTTRVYRLARLTNAGDRVILPGEASAYVGSEFVGRLRLPLVAAGEAFVVGFGVDPQLQVSRRLVARSRAVQGGNQAFAYEFRINLRNYRATPVRVQLWDRLPVAAGEAVAVHLDPPSVALSTDPTYLRTGRADNLLRWDLDVPPGAVGASPLSLTYRFRLEYARDLPPPRFQAGDLGEAPVGGPAAGGMGGMGGSRAVPPAGR